jgi:hypothetical protein
VYFIFAPVTMVQPPRNATAVATLSLANRIADARKVSQTRRNEGLNVVRAGGPRAWCVLDLEFYALIENFPASMLTSTRV